VLCSNVWSTQILCRSRKDPTRTQRRGTLQPQLDLDRQLFSCRHILSWRGKDRRARVRFPSRRSSSNRSRFHQELPYRFVILCLFELRVRRTDIVPSTRAIADAAGWVAVDAATTQSTKFSNIFSLGDASSLPNSKTAAAISSQAPVLVDNLRATMDGVKKEDLPAQYDGYASCPLLTGHNELMYASQHSLRSL